MTNDLRVNWYSRQSRKSRSGDHAFLTDAELENLTTNPASIAMERRADLQSKAS
jgi:hypothetical protein